MYEIQFLQKIHDITIDNQKYLEGPIKIEKVNMIFTFNQALKNEKS